MTRTSEQHHKLDSEGRGKCSVPMWSGGCPSGFCDAEAYGERLRCQHVWHSPQQRYVRADGKYDGFIPGLACPQHGGPNTRVFLDGNAWCAVIPDFINLQESHCGFGDSPESARAELLTGRAK